jgi:HEAT repeat protein
VQLDRNWRAKPTLLALVANDSELREYAIRALADHDDVIRTIDSAVFAAAMTDKNPRVREQATIAAGRVSSAALAPALIAATTDKEVTVRHAAIQSLRRLNALDACGEALAKGGDPETDQGRAPRIPGQA